MEEVTTELATGVPPIEIWEEDLAELAANYRTANKRPSPVGGTVRLVLDEPRLEMVAAQCTGRDASERTDRMVFRSPVVSVGKSWAQLAGAVHLSYKRLDQRRNHLKIGDLITGTMVPNGNTQLGAEWFVIHVLRVCTGMRKQKETRAQQQAEQHLAKVRSMDDEAQRLVDQMQAGMPAGDGDDGDDLGIAELDAVGRSPAAKLAIREAYDRARARKRSDEPTPTEAEQAAGLAFGRLESDGKLRFQGVVEVVVPGKWAIVSKNVFLDYSYIANKWGVVMPDDIVEGLIVPEVAAVATGVRSRSLLSTAAGASCWRARELSRRGWLQRRRRARPRHRDYRTTTMVQRLQSSKRSRRRGGRRRRLASSMSDSSEGCSVSVRGKEARRSTPPCVDREGRPRDPFVRRRRRSKNIL